MRRKLVESDLLECVLGLGPGLFYNSPMEACVVICRTRKPAERDGARCCSSTPSTRYAREQAQSFLREPHIEKILDAYRGFDGRARLRRASRRSRRSRGKDCNLSIPLYVRRDGDGADDSGRRRRSRRRSRTGMPAAARLWRGGRGASSTLLRAGGVGDEPHAKRLAAGRRSATSFATSRRRADPAAAGLERYVGLSTWIPASSRSRGGADRRRTGTTFTRRFRAGPGALRQAPRLPAQGRRTRTSTASARATSTCSSRASRPPAPEFLPFIVPD